jgi:excinuclease ABC subunit A
MGDRVICIRGARQHNLKNIDVTIPRESFVVLTGVSGSGKSSLAFDTLFAEGQRRYVESLSPYARQFIGQMDRPDVDSIEGLSPAIAVQHRAAGRNPRSTVGTVTEIHDFLRLLFARLGKPHCPRCGRPIKVMTLQEMKDRLVGLPQGSRLWIFAPVVKAQKGSHNDTLNRLARQGFLRARIDGEIHELPLESPLDPTKAHTIEVLVDRVEVRRGISARLADSLEVTAGLSDGVVLVKVDETEEWVMSERPHCVDCGIGVPNLTPKLFSFNDPEGACPACQGLGTETSIDPHLVIVDTSRPILGGAMDPWVLRLCPSLTEAIQREGKRWGVDLETPFNGLPERFREMLLNGRPDGKGGRFRGIIPTLAQKARRAKDPLSQEVFKRFLRERPCSACGGRRLRREALAVKVNGWDLGGLCSLSMDEFAGTVKSWRFEGVEENVARRVLREIQSRLHFIMALGLSYLSLDRPFDSLSGGEAQRIRLATHLGSSLTGVIYILDEPTVGLHPRDQKSLMDTLKGIRDQGNTVLVVEHDEYTIMMADHVVDLGPGAGERGGHLIYSGPPHGLAGCRESITGAYLSGRKGIPLPVARRSTSGPAIEILGACAHNLKGIDVRFPIGCMICVTGVSGSGKSSLVIDTLYETAWRAGNGEVVGSNGKFKRIKGLELLDRVIQVDQSPIGRSPRSNPATFSGVFSLIREIYAQLPESRVRGWGPGRFSFNVKGGRCEVCQGEGLRRIEMHFLPDVYATCEVCGGRRFNDETLEVRYKGLNISQVLELTVDEALRLFENFPRISEILGTLQMVGLGYIRLGQPATTLSSGEAQRIKLSRELSRRQRGRTLYVLDEPTTGLHMDDVGRLLEVLQRLVDLGNTVVVIEHNLHVIKCADYIIDLGPGAGEEGGWVVACGTPEEVARDKRSTTGRYLRSVLEGGLQAHGMER